jgi:hypothetical protein
MIDLGSFLACHKSKIVLAMRGAVAPFNPLPQTEGAHPLMYLLVGGRAEKVVIF